jgi:glycosyltransferase involved in cell wall biosynthesis
MSFSVSVIIPAYNVERFIEKAVRSALKQPEVKELVVVNDGSTDKTLQILENLQISNAKIKVYHHKGGINKGRSASRNVGLKKAKEDYIAFLDADDFYLSGRFTNDKVLLKQNLTADGVYNAVGFYFYRTFKTKERHKFQLNTVSQPINPEDLFECVVSSKYGYLHLNGITIKKSVFDVIGLLNESLIVAEDSDIIFKMALKCTLLSGVIDKPVAKRGIHASNIFNNEDLYKIYNVKLYESLISWSNKNKIDIGNIDQMFKWLWVIRFREKYTILGEIRYWFYLFTKNPKFLFSYLSIKYFPIVRLRQKLFPIFYK